MHESDAPRAQAFQPSHLGVEVVGLNVQVNAAGVIHLLQQDARLVRGGLQLGVLAIAMPIGLPSARLQKTVAAPRSSTSQSTTILLSRL